MTKTKANLNKIKYPITVYWVDDTRLHGADQRGRMGSKTFKEEPDNSKLHHFDYHYHKIEGDYFYDVHSDYDSFHEYKFFLSKEKARKYAKELNSEALKDVKRVLAALEKNAKEIAELK
jgi:hypothetical protein